MDTNPKAVGERTEGQILAAFLRAGKVVLTPFGDSQRYDLVIDEDGKFTRVQCKTGKIVNGCVRFPTCSNNWNNGTRKNYRGQVEIFAVYVPQNGKIYTVPVDAVGIKGCNLRLEPTKNRQEKDVRWAKDYEFNTGA